MKINNTKEMPLTMLPRRKEENSCCSYSNRLEDSREEELVVDVLIRVRFNRYHHIATTRKKEGVE